MMLCAVEIDFLPCRPSARWTGQNITVQRGSSFSYLSVFFRAFEIQTFSFCGSFSCLPTISLEGKRAHVARATASRHHPTRDASLLGEVLRFLVTAPQE